MAKSELIIDDREFQKFFRKLERAGKEKDLSKQIKLWFEALGFELLDLVQDEIIKQNIVDTRLLLNSFDKGSDGSVWVSKDKGFKLEVGTSLGYAKFVNDGHWTTKEGVASRFVPGVWKGDSFEYQKGAKTGMILKRKWVEGKNYWENAIRAFEPIFEKSLDKKLQEWMDKLI